MHAAPTHTSSLRQPIPQAAQLSRSVNVLTQLPPQLVRPVPHDVAHVPMLQTSPPAHALPHAPQLNRSMFVSRQVPLHIVNPIGQRQTPALHSCAPGHVLPHAPQLNRSVKRSRHTPVQSINPPVHSTVHRPALQSSPGPQPMSQPPQ